jgi:hypothetical protein
VYKRSYFQVNKEKNFLNQYNNVLLLAAERLYISQNIKQTKIIQLNASDADLHTQNILH